MQLPLAWLNNFVPTKTLLEQYGVTELAHKYSIHIAEIDDIHNYGLDGVIIAKVVSAKQHPDADKLNLVQVDLGDTYGGVQQIVCGAKNVVDANYVAVATVGTKFSEEFVIKKAKLRGEESNGMICSEDELGFQEERAAGIMRLDEYFPVDVLEKHLHQPFFEMMVELPGFESGKPFEYSLKDTVFEIDNKFITNRPDLFGVQGNAREVQALFGESTKAWQSDATFSGDIAVDIQTDKVFSYNLVGYQGIEVQPSPFSMQLILKRCDQSAKNNMVDITNYLMMEQGQPMHAFDADKVQGTIVLKEADTEMDFEALDGNTYKIQKGDIIIVDDNGILALAGIMGGESSAVSDTTTNVIFESATFDPITVRQTSSRLGLRSESLTRFEKSLDPLMAKNTLGRVPVLLDFMGLDAQQQGYFEYLDESALNHVTLTLSLDKCEKKLGYHVEAGKAKDILTKLDFVITHEEVGSLEVQVPSHRATKDISIEEDLIEEIGRMIGYEATPETPLEGAFTPLSIDEDLQKSIAVADYFGGKGCFDVVTYSITSTKVHTAFGYSDDSIVHIQNAFSEDTTQMRRNIFTTLLDKVAENKKKHSNFVLVESGKIFEKQGGKFEESFASSGVAYGKKLEEMQAMFVGYATTCNPNAKVTIEQGTNNSVMHPGKSGVVKVGETAVVEFGYLHPAIAEFFGIEADKTLIFDIHSWPVNAEKKMFVEVVKYPHIDRELNFVMDEKTVVGTIVSEIESLHNLIQEAIVLDVYRDEQKVGADKKSVLFSLKLQDLVGTITSEQAMEVQNKVVKKMGERGVVLRDS